MKKVPGANREENVRGGARKCVQRLYYRPTASLQARSRIAAKATATYRIPFLASLPADKGLPASSSEMSTHRVLQRTKRSNASTSNASTVYANSVRCSSSNAPVPGGVKSYGTDFEVTRPSSSTCLATDDGTADPLGRPRMSTGKLRIYIPVAVLAVVIRIEQLWRTMSGRSVDDLGTCEGVPARQHHAVQWHQCPIERVM